MEPLEGGYVFTFLSVLLSSSAASVPILTTITPVIEISMRMGQSYKLDLGELMNPSSQFFQILFSVTLTLRVVRKSVIPGTIASSVGTIASSVAGGADAAASPARTDALASGDVYVVQKKEMPWRVASISGGTSAWVSDEALLPVSSDIVVHQIAIKMKMGKYGGVVNAIFHDKFNGDVDSW